MLLSKQRNPQQRFPWSKEEHTLFWSENPFITISYKTWTFKAQKHLLSLALSPSVFTKLSLKVIKSQWAKFCSTSVLISFPFNGSCICLLKAVFGPLWVADWKQNQASMTRLYVTCASKSPIRPISQMWKLRYRAGKWPVQGHTASLLQS